MTGNDLLLQLLHVQSEDSSLLDRELFASYDDGKSTNATPIPIEKLLPAEDLACNGLVLIVNDEDYNPISVPHLSVYYCTTSPDPGRPFFVDHDGPNGGDAGYRFSHAHHATDHVRSWLLDQELLTLPLPRKASECTEEPKSVVD